jgi:hypothetical protein
MTPEEIQTRIETSPELQRLCTTLEDAVHFHADNSVRFDPFLIIAIISILVNVFIHCRERNADDVKNDIRNIRTLPPRKLLLLRRRINAFWRQYQAEHNITAVENPVLTALYEISEAADDDQLDALLALAYM